MKKLVFIMTVLIGGFMMESNAQCVQGNCHNGNGKFQFDNGDNYKGQWQEGKPHGTGRYEFPDGAYYNGEFKTGKFHGNGTFVWKDKTKYEGNFKEGQRDGFGKFTWANGDTYYGHWAGDAIVDTEVQTVSEVQEKPTIGN